jgi:hypothetical protein
MHCFVYKSTILYDKGRAILQCLPAITSSWGLGKVIREVKTVVNTVITADIIIEKGALY